MTGPSGTGVRPDASQPAPIGQPGESADPGVEPPQPPIARAIRWLIETAIYRFTFGWGILLLAVALASLSTGWTEISPLGWKVMWLNPP